VLCCVVLCCVVLCCVALQGFSRPWKAAIFSEARAALAGP
jgi:hypothetical protein